MLQTAKICLKSSETLLKINLIVGSHIQIYLFSLTSVRHEIILTKEKENKLFLYNSSTS